jgi:hypothetical protein
MNELDRFGGGGVAMGNIDDIVAADVDAELLRRCGDLAHRSHQLQLDDIGRPQRQSRRVAMSRRMGCTTMVSAGGKARARAIRRSYLLSGACSKGLSATVGNPAVFLDSHGWLPPQ